MEVHGPDGKRSQTQAPALDHPHLPFWIIKGNRPIRAELAAHQPWKQGPQTCWHLGAGEGVQVGETAGNRATGERGLCMKGQLLLMGTLEQH